MNIITTSIDNLYIVEANVNKDSRGSFTRLFCDRVLEKIIGNRRIAQINQSITQRLGVVRGLHFQYYPHGEMKIVSCLKGRIWDVAVDLRPNSPTYLCWHGEELSPTNKRMMVIPEGFAHGFQSLEVESEVVYLHTAHYEPSAEGGIRYDDSKIGIYWPLEVSELSSRDACLPVIDATFKGVS